MAYTRGTFPDCCSQCSLPYGGPLLIHTSTGNPPTVPGRFCSVFCGLTVPFLYAFTCTRFCLCPPRLESLFPLVLWKSYDQILLAFKVRFPGDSSPFVRSPDWEAWCGIENLHNSERTSLVLLFSSLWVTHLAAWDLTLSWLCPSFHFPASSSLSLDMEYLFVIGSVSSCQCLFNSYLRSWCSHRRWSHIFLLQPIELESYTPVKINCKKAKNVLANILIFF